MSIEEIIAEYREASKKFADSMDTLTILKTFKELEQAKDDIREYYAYLAEETIRENAYCVP